MRIEGKSWLERAITVPNKIVKGKPTPRYIIVKFKTIFYNIFGEWGITNQIFYLQHWRTMELYFSSTQ